MGSVNLDNTGSGSAITLSSDGTDLLLDGTAIGGGGGGSPDLFDESYDGTSTKPSASGTNSFAIGQEATTSAYGSLALGWRATASGTRSVALGYSLASGANSIGIAVDNNGIGATGSNSVAITRDTRASATNAIAFGQYNNVSHNNSAAFGYDVQSTAINQVSIGGTTQDVRISETYTLPKVDGSANEVLTTDGSGAVSWAAAGGSSDYVHISTQTITSAVAQVEFDLSSSDYGSYYIVAHGCTYTSSNPGDYSLQFVFYDGAYNSGSIATNRMSIRYQRGKEYSSSISTVTQTDTNLSMNIGFSPTSATTFGLSGMIGGRTNSIIDLRGFFSTAGSQIGIPRITAVAPNTSNNMTYMLVKPNSSTLASGKFSLYGLKDA